MWLILFNIFILISNITFAIPLNETKTEITKQNDEKVKIPLANVDICKQEPMKKNVLIECDAYLPMYTYNYEKDTCEGFIYGGCGGSDNLFETRDACESKCKKQSRDTREIKEQYEDEMIAEE